jgi:hypothetical protein
MNYGPSLPHTVNGGFKVMISEGPPPDIGPKAKLSLLVICRSRPGEAAVHWPIRYSTPQNLRPVQPTAGKACSLQSPHQSGHFAGSVPDDSRFVIRDHA